MAGHRAWTEIRDAADEDQERRRHVEAARREVEDEQRHAAEMAETVSADARSDRAGTDGEHAQ